MENEQELVAEKIEKGAYFADALSWYNARYIFIQTQFSQMLIVAAFAITAFLLTFIGFISFLPLVEKKLFVVAHDINPETYLKVRTLMSIGEDPDYALSRYYIDEYVKSREEYVISRSERDFNFVYKMSGQNVLEEYLSFISPDNPSSPFVVYANRGSRNIAIDQINFYDAENNITQKPQAKGKAVVFFRAQENFGARGENITDYIANIEFDYKKIGIDQETHQLTSKPEMVITNYTTKLNSGQK